jgi:hypothetical protein
MTETAPITMDDIEEEISPDKVAARCTEYTFKGRKLNPFTKTRQTAAVTMRTRCFLGGAEPDESGAYPEMFLDAQKIVWLCVVDESMARKACSQPQTAISLCLDWWEKEGGNIGSPAHVELMGLFGSILEDMQTVSAEVDNTGRKSSGDNLGES